MSAAIGNLAGPLNDGSSLGRWIASVRGAALRGAPVPPVAQVCASAIDPLEIAAALEAAGLSRRALEETGHADIFGLAEELWSTVPYEESPVEQPALWRRGAVADLGRGALYAAPALLLHALRSTADVRMATWTLPLAMTWGWAMGQVTAFWGYTMRARADVRAERRLISVCLLFAAISTAMMSVATAQLVGGGRSSIIGATCVTTYMVASAILLFHEEELLGGILLAPGVLAAGAALTVRELPALPLAGAVALSGVATVVAAGRHIGWPFVPRAAVTISDLGRALHHFVHGLLCGLALSIIVLLGADQFHFSTRTAVLTAPLLATLGLMEWQLRTFRARVEELSRTVSSVQEFAAGAVWVFLRALLVYVFGVTAFSALAGLGLRLNGIHVPTAVFAAEIALGALYFADLTLTSIGRLDVVLRAWLVGAVVGAGVMVASPMLDVTRASGAWWSAHVAVWIALVLLLLSAPRIIATACSH